MRATDRKEITRDLHLCARSGRREGRSWQRRACERHVDRSWPKPFARIERQLVLRLQEQRKGRLSVLRGLGLYSLRCLRCLHLRCLSEMVLVLQQRRPCLHSRLHWRQQRRLGFMVGVLEGHRRCKNLLLKELEVLLALDELLLLQLFSLFLEKQLLLLL